MTEISTQPRKPTITEEIMEMLEANGNIDRALKDRLMLKSIREVLMRLDEIDGIKKDVEELKKRNIATVFINHPIASVLSTFLVFIVLNTIAHSISIWSLTMAIAKFLGFPVQ